MANLLLVDDYGDGLEAWRLHLTRMGHQVMTAPDGRTALELANDHPLDAIVLEPELPDLTGFELAQSLRSHEHTSAVPLIAATGYLNACRLVAARDSGFDSVIVKPCNLQKLAAEIERLTETHEEEARQQTTALG